MSTCEETMYMEIPTFPPIAYKIAPQLHWSAFRNTTWISFWTFCRATCHNSWRWNNIYRWCMSLKGIILLWQWGSQTRVLMISTYFMYSIRNIWLWYLDFFYCLAFSSLSILLLMVNWWSLPSVLIPVTFYFSASSLYFSVLGTVRICFENVIRIFGFSEKAWSDFTSYWWKQAFRFLLEAITFQSRTTYDIGEECSYCPCIAPN